MTNIVFFSHSYRSEDAEVVRFFGDLIRAAGLTPSLDPPSDSLNDAKLRRYLGSTDGMVCILTRRNGSVSPYILHEMRTCLAAQKPLLVFVEDTIHGHVAPQRVLQRRFSRQQYIRQWRGHNHAVGIFKSYIGDDPPPPYQPFSRARSCVVLGGLATNTVDRDCVGQALTEWGYEPVWLADDVRPSIVQPPELYDALASADVAVAFGDDLTAGEAFVLGALEAAFVPTIELTARVDYPWASGTPKEYQAILHSGGAVVDALRPQFDAFEQDLLDIDDHGSIEAYYHALLDLDPGNYSATTRNLVVEAVHVGDQYNIQGQAAAVGPGAEAHHNTFEQVWEESALADDDLSTLADELAHLRATLRERAENPTQEIEAAQVGLAEEAARQESGSETMRHLRSAGQWALDVAREIGVALAQAALKSALGLP